MTVAEILERLSAAFPAFNARAVEAWAPVFRAQFGKREGPHLAEAFTQCLATFDVKAKGKLFPTPSDIEAHMPSLKRDDPAKEPAIRDHLQRRTDRARRLTTEWLEGQGLKIRDARPHQVYSACLLEAMDRAKAATERASRIILDADSLKLCVHRAISQERLRRHGPPPATNEQAWHQISAIASEWGLQTSEADWKEKRRSLPNQRKEAMAA